MTFHVISRFNEIQPYLTLSNTYFIPSRQYVSICHYKGKDLIIENNTGTVIVQNIVSADFATDYPYITMYKWGIRVGLSSSRGQKSCACAELASFRALVVGSQRS